MKIKDKKQLKELKLILWVTDGYPPIDLNENFKEVINLISEIKKLRLKLEEYKGLKSIEGYCKTHKNKHGKPLSRSWVHGLIADKKLPIIKIDGRTFIIDKKETE